MLGGTATGIDTDAVDGELGLLCIRFLYRGLGTRNPWPPEAVPRWVCSMTAPRAIRRPWPSPRPPRIAETLRKAIEWRRQLDAGEVPNQAAITRREGITRARVTQILMLLQLAPAIQERILRMPKTINPSRISERRLRPVALLDARRQHATLNGF